MEYRESVQEAPCISSCPAHLDIPRYVRAIGEGNFDEALAVVRERLPFPSVCGRICFHPCENACNGNHLLGKGPIAICDLKRFVAERPEPGGMVRFGIPDYRLPKDIPAGEIGEIIKTGVEIETDSQVDSAAKNDLGKVSAFVVDKSSDG